MTRILIDFDGVCVDFEGEFKRVYNDLIKRFAPDLKPMSKKFSHYDIFKEEELDKFWIQETFKSMDTFQMIRNRNMFKFIKKLMDNKIDFRIVTARTYNHSEVQIIFEKELELDRRMIWFVADKELVFDKFTHIIEDNPNVRGDKVYMVAHKYNEGTKDVAYRGTSTNIIKKILKELNIK